MKYRGAAHPRSRGENDSSREPSHHHTGSSPLTRGKPAFIVTALEAHRLIPAHAGKTSRGFRVLACNAAHPRSRGENGSQVGHGQAPIGSSPLTRGKLAGAGRGLVRVGLIPAHAGKTRNRLLRTPLHEAHPRSRGENSSMRSMRAFMSGSSPLTRGKLLGVRRGVVDGGLIPAHAGKTFSDGTTRMWK